MQDSATSPWHPQQRALMCRVGRSLFERGLVHATAGNISVRVPPEEGGGVLITPTDACLGWMSPEDPVWVAEDGSPRSCGRASKTLALHRAIYAAEPQAQCVIHTHSTHLVALTLLSEGRTGEDLLPALTPYFVMKVGHVPRIAYHRPGDPAVGALVAQLIAEAHAHKRRLHAVMLDRLGPNVWHRDLPSAMATLEELEETARLWWMTACQPAPLDEPRLQALREHFGASW